MALRRTYKTYEMKDFRGGICLEPENAEKNQVLDARNVWAPEGRLEQRPGWTGYGSCLTNMAGSQPIGMLQVSAGGNFWVVQENTGVTPSTFLDITAGGGIGNTYRQVNDRLYFGCTSQFDVIKLSLAVANTAATDYLAEYWNGTEWLYIPVNSAVQVTSHSGDKKLSWSYKGERDKLFNNLNSTLYFTIPADWAETVINAQTAYYIRLTYKDNAVDAVCSFNVPDLYRTSERFSCCSIDMQLPDGERGLCLGVITYYNLAGVATYKQSLFPSTRTGLSFGRAQIAVQDNALLAMAQQHAKNQLGSVAIVGPYHDVFLAYDYEVLEAKTIEGPDWDVAQVETDQSLVGSLGGLKAPYHPDYIATLATFPQCRFITYFKDKLWAANLLDDQTGIRWSGNGDAYKVWPQVNYANIAIDTDNGPITGLATLNEYLVVFKQDSIWLAIDTGVDQNNLSIYDFRKVVSGIGCVAHASIAEVNGTLVFLAEDGIYAFDGTPSVKKLSDDIDAIFYDQIAKSQRGFASGVHWRTRHCYMLSCCLEGDQNDTVIVYDYKHDACWIWKDIDVDCWIRTEGEYDDEEILFLNSTADLCKFDTGDLDHGAAIESYVLTHRVGMDNDATKRWRKVMPNCSNIATNCDITVYVLDEDVGSTVNLNLEDENEAKLGSLILGTDKVVSKKRREKRNMYRKTGKWCQIKIEHSNKGEKFELNSLEIGCEELGVR